MTRIVLKLTRPVRRRLDRSARKTHDRHQPRAGGPLVRPPHQITPLTEHRCSELFIALLERLRQAQPQARRIHLVLDNYGIHSSGRVQAYLASQADLFVLHFLPPYSPEHNKIDRLWRELHANVTRNHRCKGIHELMVRVTTYLGCENRWRRKRLLDATKPNRCRGWAAA